MDSACLLSTYALLIVAFYSNCDKLPTLMVVELEKYVIKSCRVHAAPTRKYRDY